MGNSLVHVISGAAGIGKSWSINAFAITLLGLKMKVFFHSGSTGEAWCVTHDSEPTKVSPKEIAHLQADGWKQVVHQICQDSNFRRDSTIEMV